MIGDLYLAGAYLRRKVHEKNIIKPKKLTVPVISIGNLTTGGTGKTPLTIWLAKYLQSKGFNPVVLSRGYKRKSKGSLIVSDGKEIFTTWQMAGDEPYLIAKYKIPVVVSKSRYEAGILALKELSPDIFILDDGFQHFQLRRDLDILVNDMSKPFWEERPLPFGKLREPKSFYRYADVILATKIEGNENKLKLLEKFKKPFYKTFEETKFITNFKKEFRLDFLKGKTVVVFSGLGNNDYFFKKVEKLSKDYSFKIKKFIPLPDHFDYKNFKVDEKADLYLTTEKDLIKLNYPDTFAIKYKIKPEEGFLDFLDLKIENITSKRKYKL